MSEPIAGGALPYPRRPEFLTQTLLKQLEKDPATFYLRTCLPEEQACPPEAQSYPMAVGSAFDALVKTELTKRLGCACPPLEVMLARIETAPAHDPTLVTRALAEGRRLLKAYLRLGCLDKILEEGLDQVDLEPGEVEVPETERHVMGRRIAGVPLQGHPDARIKNKEGLVYPLDWKVTGPNTREPRPARADGTPGEPLQAPSPCPGYRRLYDTARPLSHLEGPHARHGECFGALHPDWATQLVTYHWLLRPGTARSPGFQPGFGAIDQVIVHADGRVRVAQLRCRLSPELQQQVRDRYVAAWEQVQRGALLPPAVVDPVLASMLRGLRV